MIKLPFPFFPTGAVQEHLRPNPQADRPRRRPSQETKRYRARDAASAGAGNRRRAETLQHGPGEGTWRKLTRPYSNIVRE